MPADRRLSPRERVRLIAEILAAYARARRALRRAPITAVVDSLRVQEQASPHPPGEPLYLFEASPTEHLEEVRRLGHAVSRTLALLPGDTRCLARSLVLTRLLARRGIPARLVIGARTAPEFLAHAWVEYGGEPVLSPGDGSFGRLVEL